MELIRRLLAPLLLLGLTIGMMILGFASNATGLVAIALLCAWPLFFGALAWTIRGLRDTYQLVPKSQIRKRSSESLG